MGELREFYRRFSGDSSIYGVVEPGTNEPRGFLVVEPDGTLHFLPLDRQQPALPFVDTPMGAEIQ